MDIQAAENEKLYDFFRRGKICDYKKNEIILRAAEVPQGVYCIQHGHVKVYSLTDRGEENLHVIYKPGEVFPLVWTFKGIIRNVFYEALDDVRVWRVPRDDLQILLRTDIEAAGSMLGLVVEQFHIYSDRVDNLEYAAAYERVVYRLLFLASRFGVKHGNNVVINPPITHQNIGNSINLARETVSREVEKLERNGLVEFKNHQLIIKDVERLQQEIGEPTSLDLWGLR